MGVASCGVPNTPNATFAFKVLDQPPLPMNMLALMFVWPVLLWYHHVSVAALPGNTASQ